MQAGLDEYLVKPIQISDLERILSGKAGDRFSATDSESLDRERLDTLRALEKQVGEEVVEPMVHSFLDSMPEVISALREAAGAEDWSHLRSEIHGFLGRALNLGAVGPGAVCRELQEQARAQQKPELDLGIRRLEVELERTAREFRKYLAEHP